MLVLVEELDEPTVAGRQFLCFLEEGYASRVDDLQLWILKHAIEQLNVSLVKNSYSLEMFPDIKHFSSALAEAA